MVTTGAGNPAKYMASWLAAGIRVIPVVASVAMAKLVTRLGASAVIAEGGESGGHVGDLTHHGAGPAGLRRDAAACRWRRAASPTAAAWRRRFMLGACGVQMGTRFLAAEECSIHPEL